MLFKDQFGKKYEVDPQGLDITWRISVYGVVKNKKGELLMMMPHFNAQWQFPGGQIEIDETIENTIIREFGEETGYKVKGNLNKLIYLYENNFYDAYFKKYFHSIQMTFESELTDEKQYENLIEKGEGMDYGEVKWVNPNSLTKETTQHTHWPIIQILQMAENDTYKVAGKN